MIKQCLTIILILLSVFSNAQNYPKGYFRNPLNIPILLAGNFGECRPNHFHSGLDIKTNGKENLPVFAAADGYISRIKMEPGGFGHALYIAHANGYTTLYAHLNNFMPEIQRYVRARQYENEKWELDLQLNPTQFPVKKGQQIAWSGNTGSSTAPHLHFEIRDNKTEHPLNPMLFGFDIEDHIPPIIQKLAIYNMSSSIYEQTPKTIQLKKKEGIYTTDDTLFVNGSRLGIGLQTDDYMNGSENTLTFYKTSLSVDNNIAGTITLDDIGYDITRYQHAYIDYKTKKLSKQFIQLLFQLSGNQLNSIYKWNSNTNGVINIPDTKPHQVSIEMTDANNNKTSLSFYIRSLFDSTTTNCTSDLFKTNVVNKFETPNVKFTLNEKALYDDICFSYATSADLNAKSNRHRIHFYYVPVHSYFDLYIKPNKAIAFTEKDKIAMVYYDGEKESGKVAIADGAWYMASVRNFGEYRLVVDTIPPIVKTTLKNNAVLSKANRISFNVKDEITSVKKIRGEIDGKWVCFERHEDNFFYTFDEHCAKGKHRLAFMATDENGNTQKIMLNFTR